VGGLIGRIGPRLAEILVGGVDPCGANVQIQLPLDCNRLRRWGGLGGWWRLVNAGHIPLTSAGMLVLSNVTLLLCPSSLMLMEVDPIAPLNVERAIRYLTAIVSNGLFYAVVVALFRKGARNNRSNVER
jgi:hypothetical protein